MTNKENVLLVKYCVLVTEHLELLVFGKDNNFMRWNKKYHQEEMSKLNQFC